MCSEVQSITEHTIFSAIEINNFETDILCTRDKRRVKTGFASSRDRNLNKEHFVITKNEQTKIRNSAESNDCREGREERQEKSRNRKTVIRYLWPLYGYNKWPNDVCTKINKRSSSSAHRCAFLGFRRRNRLTLQVRYDHTESDHTDGVYQHSRVSPKLCWPQRYVFGKAAIDSRNSSQDQQ